MRGKYLILGAALLILGVVAFWTLAGHRLLTVFEARSETEYPHCTVVDSPDPIPSTPTEPNLPPRQTENLVSVEGRVVEVVVERERERQYVFQSTDGGDRYVIRLQGEDKTFRVGAKFVVDGLLDEAETVRDLPVINVERVHWRPYSGPVPEELITATEVLEATSEKIVVAPTGKPQLEEAQLSVRFEPYKDGEPAQPRPTFNIDGVTDEWDAEEGRLVLTIYLFDVTEDHLTYDWDLLVRPTDLLHYPKIHIPLGRIAPTD